MFLLVNFELYDYEIKLIIGRRNETSEVRASLHDKRIQCGAWRRYGDCITAYEKRGVLG